MRKQILSGFLAAVMAVSCLAVPATDGVSGLLDDLVVSAEDTYTSGDYTYTVSDGEATITGYSGSDTELSIPSTLDGYTVTEIGIFAFESCYSITSVIIPDSVTTIGYYAFYLCTSLTSITIPDSVTSIGFFAFGGCTSLTSITIPNSITSIESYVFLGCTSLTNVTIPDSVNSIGNYAFDYCPALTSITIPNSVTSIGSSAFSSCTGLTSITIPDSVTSIGNSPFSGCTNLKSINVDSGNEYYSSLDGVLYNNDLTTLICCPGGKSSISILDSVTSIGSYAFDFCTGLTKITIPNSVTSIGGGLFCDCSSLTSVTLSDSVTSITEYTFVRCINLASVIIPNSVTSIENYAFTECSSLTGITIPDSVISIGDHAFGRCDSLTSITIPDSVTSIGSSAFWFCANLKNIDVDQNNEYYASLDGVLYNKDLTALICCPASKSSISIPNSVTSIGGSAFSGCENITSITISSLVTSIGKYAFHGCTSLTNVFYAGTEDQWNAITMGSDNDCLTGANIHYNATSHTFTSEITTPATCTTAGTRTYTCSVCGNTYTKSIAATGHSYTTKKVAATYAAQGYTLHTCSNCGASYKDNYTAKKTVPTVTVSSKYSSTTSAVRINWTKVSGATGYRIYRYNSSTKKWESIKTIKDGSTTTYKQTGLKAGTTYKYKVKAYVKYNGTNYWSTSSSSTITTSTKPAQVTIKSTSKSKTAIKLTWKKVTGASGYQVQRYNSSTKKWVTVKTIKSGSTVSYKNTGLKKGTAYKYRIRAYRTVNGTKLYGKWSSTKKVTTKS